MTRDEGELRIYKFIIPSDEKILQERDGAEPFEWQGLMCTVVAFGLDDARRMAREYLIAHGELYEWIRFAPVESFPIAPGVICWASV